MVTLFPRILLALVLVFDSRRGKQFDFICRNEKKSRKKRKGQLLRAPGSVGRYNSTRVDEGRQC